MVFGWGKKKEERTQQSEKKEITLNEIPKIIDEILHLRTTQTLNEIKSLRNSTEPLINELSKIGQTLEKDNLAVDEIDKHLRIIVVRGKKQVIDAIKKDIVELPKVSTIDDAKELNDVLNQILKKTGDVLGRQTRVIHIFAKKYAEQLKEILAQMNSNHFEIQQLIKNYDETNTNSKHIINSLKTLSEHDDEIKHHSDRISQLKKENEILNANISVANDSIKKIKSSKEYGDYTSLTESLEKLNAEKTHIKNQIDDQFTKISRPLGRYEYVSSDKEQKNLLVKLLDDPIEVLSTKNKDMIIIILENVRKGILSGSISVKDLEKSMSQITETVEMLDFFIHNVDEFKGKIQNIENKMSQFERSELNKLEKDLEKTLDQKMQNEQKIITFENELKEFSTKTPYLINELESKLRIISNIQYTIVKPS
jgi:hypothetical protein